ncbi:MAG: TetR/AcrR family transcriptional regulator [Planctomycetota bacterium]
MTPAESGRDLKRRLLLAASYRVFTEKGYHRARLEEVAKQAGYSKASVYNYFDDKEDLFLQTSVMATTECVAALESELEPGRSAIEDIECMLRYLLSDSGQLFSFVQAVAEYHGEVSIATISQADRQKLAKQHRAGLRNILKTIAKAVESGKRRREFRCGVDAVVTARFLTGLVRSVLLRWRLDGRRSDAERELSEIMAFARQGMGVLEGPSCTAQADSLTEAEPLLG